MAAPIITSSNDRARRWFGFALGVAVTIGAVVGLVRLWPDDESTGGEGGLATELPSTIPADSSATVLPGRGPTGEPSQRGGTPSSATNLFAGGLPDVVAQLSSAAGGPAQVLELTVYDTYAYLAYRDPTDPGNIDRRMWRDGSVGQADANPIDDRVDADTEPGLFSLADLDVSVLPRLTADAVTRYPMPVAVTHVVIDRFLPFDERVLIRVYASPTDGRSGGGYVSYDTAGGFVSVCC
ncbi:MAG: hypothetical protein Q8K58_08605 [Acidimicrobiales bacterium]|nr:hypothetical protein [Acidimicrobiales bacterium]